MSTCNEEITLSFASWNNHPSLGSNYLLKTVSIELTSIEKQVSFGSVVGLNDSFFQKKPEEGLKLQRSKDSFRKTTRFYFCTNSIFEALHRCDVLLTYSQEE